MTLSRYEVAFGLFVDYRYRKDYNRVWELLKSKGIVTFKTFIDGKGNELPPSLYTQISPTPVPTWKDGPASYSHFVALKKIIECAKAGGATEFLFVEDDLVFTEEFDEVVRKAHADLPNDWDMLYYGANHSGHKTRVITPNILRVFGSACTHCVAIRNTIFDDILALPPDKTIDWNIANRLHGKYNCYAVWPNVAIQRPGYSYLWKQRVDYSDLWKDRGESV